MIWREHLMLLHLPTTSVLLSLAVLGSLLAQEFYPDRLLLFVTQIFLGGSLAANHFDEIVDRPWRTEMSIRRLWIVAIVGLLAFVAIGLYLAMKVSYNYVFFVIAESFFIVAYDLELFKGIFHNASTLGASWGLVFLGGYYLQDQVLSPLLLIVFSMVCICSMQGISLYERGKSFGKDYSHADPGAKFAWETLRIGILTVDVVTLILAAYKFWPFISLLI
jgi:4-hydroxybenzoate polyprenyltransferase